MLAAAKAGSDAAGGLVLTGEQLARHRAVCLWCVLAAGASAAAFPLTVPEARMAWRRLGI